MTFVASAAVQTIADDRLKLHGTFELERQRKDEPNERIELWRFATQDTFETVDVLRDQLVAEMTDHLESALATFDKCRSSGLGDG